MSQVGATVLQLSDTHLAPLPGEGVFGRDADERLAIVLDAWIASGEVADLVLLTGDLTNEGDLAATLRLAHAVAELGLPMLALAGNHDRADAVAAAFGTHDLAELDGWRIVAVDTVVPGETAGRVDVAAALARLDALDARPTVVALHHPPLSRSTGAPFQLEGAGALLKGLAARPHVRAVVGGHLHDAVELTSAGGLPVLGCPSTVMGITHEGDEMHLDARAITGARILELHDDGHVTSRLLRA